MNTRGETRLHHMAAAPSDPNSQTDASRPGATPRDHTPLQPMGQESTALKLNTMFVMSKSFCTVGRSPRFSGCGWTRDHMSGFAEALPMFKKVRVLDLCYNNFKDEAAEVLASALKATCVLCYWRHRQPIQHFTPGIVQEFRQHQSVGFGLQVKIYESASDVLVCGMVFPSSSHDSCGEQCSLVSLGDCILPVVGVSRMVSWCFIPVNMVSTESI